MKPALQPFSKKTIIWEFLKQIKKCVPKKNKMEDMQIIGNSYFHIFIPSLIDSIKKNPYITSTKQGTM